MMWLMLFYVVAGFLVVDFNLAWYHYRLNKRCAVTGLPFSGGGWQIVSLKISICAGLMLVISLALIDQ